MPKGLGIIKEEQICTEKKKKNFFPDQSGMSYVRLNKLGDNQPSILDKSSKKKPNSALESRCLKTQKKVKHHILVSLSLIK